MAGGETEQLFHHDQKIFGRHATAGRIGAQAQPSCFHRSGQNDNSTRQNHDLGAEDMDDLRASDALGNRFPGDGAAAPHRSLPMG
jgi:hypothetical protein